jgi:hypothetical protein
MASNFSPLDPIFYLHHAFVDYLWVKAQAGWTAQGLPLDSQFKGMDANRKMCSAKTHMPGYPIKINFESVFETSSLCVAYAEDSDGPSQSFMLKGKALKSGKEVKQTSDKHDDNYTPMDTCFKPLPSSWFRSDAMRKVQEDLLSICHETLEKVRTGQKVTTNPIINDEVKPLTANRLSKANENSNSADAKNTIITPSLIFALSFFL